MARKIHRVFCAFLAVVCGTWRRAARGGYLWVEAVIFFWGGFPASRDLAHRRQPHETKLAVFRQTLRERDMEKVHQWVFASLAFYILRFYYRQLVWWASYGGKQEEAATRHSLATSHEYQHL